MEASKRIQHLTSNGLADFEIASTPLGKVAEASGEWMETAIQLSPAPTILLCPKTLSIRAANDAAQQFLDCDPIVNQSLIDFVPERDLGDFEQLSHALRTGRVDRGATYISSGDGIGLARFALQRLPDSIVAVDQTKPGRRMGAGRPLSETDPLTGVSNRRLLEHRIQRALDRSSQQWGLLFIDLNNYKQVNDAHGHVIGDKVLIDFARKLEAGIRPGDLLARFGGDEFVILVERIPDVQHLRAMADRISKEASVEVDLDGTPIAVGASIGCVMASDENGTVENMILAADRDMYRVKRNRKAR